MKFKKTLIALTTSLFFIACGDNTTQHITSDISNIKIDVPASEYRFNDTYEVYSTDELNLSAVVNYFDGNSADATNNVTWKISDSDYNITTLSNHILQPITNVGELDLSALYKDFNSTVHVKFVSLKNIDNSVKIVSSDDIIEVEQNITLHAIGDFASGDYLNAIDDKIIYNNITWTCDNNGSCPVNENNSITLVATQTGNTTVTATIFDMNITKSFIVE